MKPSWLMIAAGGVGGFVTGWFAKDLTAFAFGLAMVGAALRPDLPPSPYRTYTLGGPPPHRLVAGDWYCTACGEQSLDAYTFDCTCPCHPRS